MPSKCSSETLTSENLPVGVLRCSALPVTDERPCASFSQPSTQAQAAHSLLLTLRFSFCTCPVFPHLANFSLPLLQHYHQHANMLFYLRTTCHAPITAPFPCSLYSRTPQGSCPYSRYPSSRLYRSGLCAMSWTGIWAPSVPSTVLGSQRQQGTQRTKQKPLCPQVYILR